MQQKTHTTVVHALCLMRLGVHALFFLIVMCFLLLSHMGGTPVQSSVFGFLCEINRHADPWPYEVDCTLLSGLQKAGHEMIFGLLVHSRISHTIALRTIYIIFKMRG